MVSGDLQVFPLLPVMQMLLSSGRSGEFTVDHPRGGTLWFEHGELTHARSGQLRGEAALQLMCSLDQGTFTFEADRQAPERTLNLKQDMALHRMLLDNESWAQLMRIFPDWSRTLRFSVRWNPQQPVTRPQYQALTLVGQGHNIRQMIDRSELPPRVLLDILRPFVANGLVEVA